MHKRKPEKRQLGMDSPCNNHNHPASKFHTVKLRNGQPCKLKKHYRDCDRQVIGYLETLAAQDPERFVWCQFHAIVKNAKKWKDKRPYSARHVARAIENAEKDGIVKAAWKDRNGWRPGYVIASHDAITVKQGCWCVRADGHCYLPSSRPKHIKRHATSKPQEDHKHTTTDTNLSSPVSSEISAMSSPVSSRMSSPVSSESESDVITHVITESLEVQQSQPVDSDTPAVLVAGLEGPSLEYPYQALFSLEKAALGSLGDAAPCALNTNSNSDNRPRKELIVGSVFFGALPTSVDYLSDKEFDEDYLSQYEHTSELQACIEQAVQELAHEPYLGRYTNARLMFRAMELLRSVHNLNVPRGWVPAMKQLQKQPNGYYAFTSKQPDDVRELRGLLIGPHWPCWYKTNGHITQAELSLLSRLSISDHHRHPEFMDLVAEETLQQSAQREAEAMAQARSSCNGHANIA
jgi:hypothetical protein